MRAEPASRDAHAALASQAASGDEAALTMLLRALAPLMLRLARGILGPVGHDAEDVVQESMFGLSRALVDFRGESTVAHFAARITIRTAVAARRRSKKRDSIARDATQDDLDLAMLPDAAASSQRRRDALNEALASIPSAQAETLVMRIVLGHSIEEIAEATVVPVNTVRSRLRLAKEALARQIALDPVLLDVLEVER